MDLSGQLVIKKTKKLLKNKRYRIRIFVVLACLIILTFRSCINNLKVKNFFKKYPEGIVIRELKPEDMITAVADKFLGKNVKVQIHCLVKGDNYWIIGNKNEVSIDTILGCNPFLKNYYAAVGEKIIAIDKGGCIHNVHSGENLEILAKLYNVEKSEIKKNNRISLFRCIRKGDLLFIPKAKPKVFTEEMYKAILKRKVFANPSVGWYAGRGFGKQMHPIYKRIKFHKGIDMKASHGSGIFAAADGVVRATSRGGSYGKVIIIDHANGFQTRYAHCSKIYVRTGQKVKQRKCIGRVGNTGLSTHAHLHFEIRKNGKPIDPMKYLW